MSRPDFFVDPLPLSEDPATRARALARKALEADAWVVNLARKYKASLRRLREFRERGCWSGAHGASFWKWQGAYWRYTYCRKLLARAKDDARAEQRLAENAGVVFEPRRRVRRSPRGAPFLPRPRDGRGAPAHSAALQRLALDRARTALKIQPLFAAWLRAQAEEAETRDHPGLRLNKIESIVYGTTYPDMSVEARLERLELYFEIDDFSDESDALRLAMIESSIELSEKSA